MNRGILKSVQTLDFPWSHCLREAGAASSNLAIPTIISMTYDTRHFSDTVHLNRRRFDTGIFSSGGRPVEKPGASPVYAHERVRQPMTDSTINRNCERCDIHLELCRFEESRICVFCASHLEIAPLIFVAHESTIVPMKPTEEMIAAYEAVAGQWCRKAYAALLAAAPVRRLLPTMPAPDHGRE